MDHGGPTATRFEIRDPWPTLEEAMPTARWVAEQARAIYGDVLDSVWLYGSRARGDHWNESDLDLLVVISEPVIFGDERYRKLRDSVWEKYMGTEKWGFIEVFVCQTERFEHWDTMFYRNVRSEALRVA